MNSPGTKNEAQRRKVERLLRAMIVLSRNRMGRVDQICPELMLFHVCEKFIPVAIAARNDLAGIAAIRGAIQEVAVGFNIDRGIVDAIADAIVSGTSTKH
jgi:hypothetical protein